MARNKLFVGNLSYTVTRDQLMELFAAHGEVMDVKVFDNRGFAFVEMAGQEEAEKAMEALNGTEFEGRTLNIDEARDRPQARGFRGSYRNNRGGRGGGRGGRGRGGGRGQGGGRGRY